MKVLLLVLSIVSCLAQSVESADRPSGKTRKKDASQTLIGQWQCLGPNGSVSLVFESGNRLVFGGEPSTYMLVKGAVRVLDDGVPVDYPYTLKGESLSFVTPENERYQCRKGKSAAPQASLAGDSSLMKWFAGSYYHYSGSTERRVVLCPNGTFRSDRESGYSGRFTEGGVQTGAWGSASQASNKGKWAIRGDQRQGTISLVYSDGGRGEISYRSGGDRGCFYFNGTLFCYEGNGNCR